MVITIVVTLYATRITLQALGASDLGIYYLVAGVISMLSFLNTAMAVSTQRFLSFYLGQKNRDILKEIFDSSIVLHMLVGIALVILLEIVGLFLFNGILNIPVDRIYAAKIIYQFMILNMFLTIVSVPYKAIINSHENMLAISIINILESIGKLIIALLIIRYTRDRLILYGFLLSVLTFLVFISMRQVSRTKYIECRGKIIFNKKNKFMKELSSFAGWNLYGILSGIFRGQGITLVLNHFFGTVVNAAYGIASQVNGQISNFSSNLLMAFNPQIMKSEGSGERERMLILSKTTSKFSFFILSFFTIPLIIEMDYVINLWLKEVPEHTIIFCQLILVLTLIGQLTIGLQSSAQAVGKIKVYQFVIGTINLSAPVIGFFFLKYGIWDAYIVIIVTIFVEIVAGISRILFLRYLAGMSIRSYVLDVIKPAILISLFVFFVTFEFNKLLVVHDFLRLVITVGLSSILLILGIYKFGLSTLEKKKILNLVGNLKRRISRSINN